MCTTDCYTYVYPDGHQQTVNKPWLCPSSRHGRPCPKNIVLQHRSQSVPYGYPVVPVFIGPSSYVPRPYMGAFPPSPSYTPRNSTPTHRSGDDSDRSHHSAASSRRRGMYNPHRMESSPSRQGQGRRTVLVENPPTPSTPPQAFTLPRTAPSSPNFANAAPFISDASPRGATSGRPFIVDERPRHDREGARIHIEFRDGSWVESHSRNTSSTSSYDSRHSHISASEDEEMRRRRRAAETASEETLRLSHEEEIRQQRLQARIAKANAEIAKRKPVPLPSAPKQSSTAAKATRNVGDREAELLERIQQLEAEQARHERGRAARRDEEEAQKERLMQRMQPQRRATVGPGSRRPRVGYTDGVYRWE